jgi:hypothetical protein
MKFKLLGVGVYVVIYMSTSYKYFKLHSSPSNSKAAREKLVWKQFLINFHRRFIHVLFNEIKITAVCISPYIWALVCNYEHLYKFLNSPLISKAEPQMFILFFEQMPRLVVMVGVIIEQITKTWTRERVRQSKIKGDFQEQAFLVLSLEHTL